jgi:hypothetical protein
MNTDEEAQRQNVPAVKTQERSIEAQNKSQTSDIPPAEISNLERIRDILFGTQARDYEKRFVRLEESLLKQTSTLRDEISRRCDFLESYIKREVESLHERDKSEQHERAETTHKLTLELKQISDTFEKKMAQLAEHVTVSQRELRQQLLEQSKILSDEMRQRCTDISAVFEQQMQEMRVDKTDRSTLATVFMDAALRLSHELHLPGMDTPHDMTS